MSDSISLDVSFTPCVKMMGLSCLPSNHLPSMLWSQPTTMELLARSYASERREIVVSEGGCGEVSKTKEKDCENKETWESWEGKEGSHIKIPKAF